MNFFPETDKISGFLEKNRGKKVVVVQGLGFVGSVMALVVANSDQEDYAVIGVDLPNSKNAIDSLNNGIFPIQCNDPTIYTYHRQAINKGNFFATSNEYAYSKADVIIVDINLDVLKNSDSDNHLDSYEVNMNGFSNAISTIATNCKEDVLVLIETTVPPGTCEKFVKPVMEREFDRRGLPRKYKIGHSYERVMPGPNYVDSIKNFYRVYSGMDEESADAVEKFLKTIITTDQFPLTRLSGTTSSEISKVLENSYRAMNIAFMQEWTEFAESAHVNLFEIVNAISMRPTHQNIMRPGLGVGGYCLTKDSLLASWASQELFGSVRLVQSERAIEINDRMPMHTYYTIKHFYSGNINGKKILILGISYLKNVGDTRSTPVELLYKKLLGDGATIVLHDPFLKYWNEQNLTIDQSVNIHKTPFDAVIIGTPHDLYFKGGMLNDLLANSAKLDVFDPHGSIPEELLDLYHNKHKFKINGRGDV
jgi:UDP-N-acetyl-D-glucosamine dehydrogenase